MAGEVKVEVKGDKGAMIDEIDFAKVPLAEAFKILECTTHGLTSAQAAQRLIEYGPNKLPESKRIPLLVFLGYMWNPLAWAMEIAAIISIALLDYADFALIVALLLVNSVISYVEESNADAAIKALAGALAPKALCFRDGTPAPMDAINLVPGDVIIIRLGNIVPADVKIMEEEGGAQGEEQPMQIDQAALTGESLPAKKFTGDVAFSGSAVKQGERHAVVYATGVHTFFGRAAALISGTNNVANLQIVMTNIGFCCLGTILVWVTIELAVQFGHYHHGCTGGEDNCPTLTNMLVIIVGGIPIAMPTVLSVTLALGAFKLAKEGAIVARMSAVEEMAGMDMLCSDKTGTLTLNKLSVEPNSIFCPSNMPIADVLKWAALSANTVTEEPIDMVLAESYPGSRADLMKQYKLLKYIPFNPTDKFTCAIMEEIATNRRIRILKGSPQVVLKKAWNADVIGDAVNAKMVDFAQRGFRSLGLAMAEGDGFDGGATRWEMIGLVSLFDPPRHDTKETIENCHHQGIEVKMITGDHLLIGKETARMLGMGTNIFPSEVLIKAKQGHTEFLHGFADVHEMVEKANGFAEVFPEHKFEIVAMLQENDHICGMTGDGVNDAPALKKADVGIAVHGATDAARGAADIVLTEPGLSTIVTAVVGARKIFQRMTTYSKYTVAMTFRICFTFGLLTVIYDWYFPTILIVILAVFNDGAMIALSKDRVTPSKLPNAWNLRDIFTMGIVYGLYLTLSSWVLYQVAVKGNWFSEHCSLFSLEDRHNVLMNDCTTLLAGRGDLTVSPTSTVLKQVWQYPPYASQVPGISRTRPSFNNITLLDQCVTEQQYVRGSMMRTLLYNQVSISGQALVFVVRHQGWSIMQRAGSLTYIAFFAAQAGSTLIAIFGFAGYNFPPQAFENCQFCQYSTGGDVLFFHKQVPVDGTESVFVASVIGCTAWVIVAWIWAAMWYVPLDLIKWALCYILNEDGFRDRHAFAKGQRRNNLQRNSLMEQNTVGGMTTATHQNPLGRTSLSKPVGEVIPVSQGAVVAINRTSVGGIGRVSANPNHTQGIARRSMQAAQPAPH